MNVVMFITDQERAIQHFPKGWGEEHLLRKSRLAPLSTTQESPIVQNAIAGIKTVVAAGATPPTTSPVST